MLKDQALQSLQNRRMAARLTFLYKLVEGLVSAISPDAFLKLQRPKRQICAKKLKTLIPKTLYKFIKPKTLNPVVEQSNTLQYSISFFLKTVRDWNSLEEATVCEDTIEGFVAALHSSD